MIQHHMNEATNGHPASSEKETAQYTGRGLEWATKQEDRLGS